MSLALLLLLTLGTDVAGPLDTAPRVRWYAPDALEAKYREIRRLREGGLIERAKAYGALGLEHSACAGLVDLRALDAAREAGLEWQDDVAGREWARPALARVLVEAHRAWRARHPGQSLGVGDVAQAGCGQIDPGTLTRWVRGPVALALLARAVPVAGIPTVLEVEPEPGGRGPRLIERRVVGRAEDGLLFVHLRRYRETGVRLTARQLEARVRAIAEAGELAVERAGSGQWRQRWVDVASYRQALVVVTRRRQPFTIADAVEVSLAPWAPARPGERRGERRYRPDDGDRRRWRAYKLIEEGSHVTHMAGRDADLSYAVRPGSQRFALDPDGIDLAATWDWFETLVETSEALGTPIDRIVVGGRVLPLLLAEIPGARESRLVKERILKVVKNHDDHQHVRLAIPLAAADAEALRVLGASTVGRR